MLCEQFSGPTGHRNLPIHPPLSCHTSYPCHFEFSSEHLGMAIVPGDSEAQFPMENKYKGLGRVSGHFPLLHVHFNHKAVLGEVLQS